MHRSVGTCFVRNILSSSKVVKRQMAAQNTVGFQSKFWLLPRRAAAPTSAAASTGAVHTAAWCWGSQKLVTYSLCSLFSVQCYLQTETQDWMVWPLSRKVIFPGTILTLELGSSVCGTSFSGQSEYDGERSDGIDQYSGRIFQLFHRNQMSQKIALTWLIFWLASYCNK